MGVQLDEHLPLLLAPGEGETVVDRPERTLRILAELDEVIVTWFRYEPGEEGPEPHIHRRHTDAFYVLEGELEVGLGPDLSWLTASPGTLAAAPPNVVHTFRNSSDATAIFLNLHAPSMGFGNVIRGHGEEGFDQFDPPADGGRPYADAVFSGPGEGESFARETSMLVAKADLPQLSVLDSTFLPAFEGVDLHVHDDRVDAFHVLEGEVEFLTGGDSRRAGQDTFLAAPRGIAHGFRNPGREPLRMLNLHAPPGGFVERLRQSA
jgi:quercetin dioxygenase-like cupin family protein